MCENETGFFSFDHVRNNGHLQIGVHNPHFLLCAFLNDLLVSISFVLLPKSACGTLKPPIDVNTFILIGVFVVVVRVCCVCNLIIAMVIYICFP